MRLVPTHGHFNNTILSFKWCLLSCKKKVEEHSTYIVTEVVIFHAGWFQLEKSGRYFLSLIRIINHCVGFHKDHLIDNQGFGVAKEK